ncbi:predicted protein, partial [Postia placenta Mad-698-R]
MSCSERGGGGKQPACPLVGGLEATAAVHSLRLAFTGPPKGWQGRHMLVVRAARASRGWGGRRLGGACIEAAVAGYSPSAINPYKFLQILPKVHKMAYKETPLPRALEHDFWPDVLEVVNYPKVAHLMNMGKPMTKLFNAAKDATIPGHSPDQLLAA